MLGDALVILYLFNILIYILYTTFKNLKSSPNGQTLKRSEHKKNINNLYDRSQISGDHRRLCSKS